MEKKQMVLTVRLENVKNDFNVNAYASGIAYRALPWVGKVSVEGEETKVEMSSEQK